MNPECTEVILSISVGKVAHTVAFFRAAKTPQKEGIEHAPLLFRQLRGAVLGACRDELGCATGLAA
ncbi:MAG: hypothetical protein BGO25_04265 [Acidobacteriales bacterium 59-55]|jgi:hypothetical protein|uniref:hypothetical protein n=1 Tax=Acidipila rosea TaxID=768535 RepID=UPI00095CD9F9|nr:hypothetical protein [Acidipila rosea]MBN9616990.1 hypothetical protein [Terriglobales bacterium]OJV40354.1 MAG: hypothetical protein BGO25_04265 [Acidobacteriales bacterium 59-55]